MPSAPPLATASARACALALLVGLGGACTDADVAAAAAPDLPETNDPPYVAPAESCDPVRLDAIRAFDACSTGGGVFGAWTIDERGLPAYDYGLDQHADARAAFFNTEGLDRRDHLFSFGNARVVALLSNDGEVQVVSQDRGPTLLDALDPPSHAYGGGFSFVDDGEATWCSAYAYRPTPARTRRRFGVDGAETETVHHGVSVSRRLSSPPGDAALVIDEVTLENRSGAPKALRHYEYWDVRRRPIEIDWAVSGKPVASFPGDARAARDARNALFDESVSWDPAARVLALRRAYSGGDARPARETASAEDLYPGDPFVAVLAGDVADVYTDDAAFFGDGDARAPAAVVARAAGDGTSGGPLGPARSGQGQPRMLTVRSDLTLAPGERRTLRFAYGWARMGEPIALDPALADAALDLRAESDRALAPHLLYFGADRDPVLHRELAWHASQLEASVGVRDYLGGHVVPQGSAYLYLHGADGAARDFALFSVPLVYTHASLAREELAVMMGMQRADQRRFLYALVGHGMVDDALGLHAQPSDLDLFFLWALGEYVGATGDEAFLDAPAPYWPRDAVPGATVLGHARDAVRHLLDVVGTGPHGLVRIGDGDWSDGVVMRAKDRALAIEHGESVPNTQMAIAVLPRVARLLATRDAALSAEIDGAVAALRPALASAFTGAFYGRAFFGDGVLAGADAPDLEAQVWGLIGASFPSTTARDAAIARIGADLDDPSPTGATLTPGGEVWPAVSGLLSWGYAQSDPERAWRHLARNTLAAHATAFPALWYGIWSGPDGMQGVGGDRPGEAWYSVVTPMTDFPVANANQHAMPLLAALRVAGVEATERGLSLAPHVPGRRFALSCELLDLEQQGATLRGTYRPPGASPRQIEVAAPLGSTIVRATVAGQPVAVPGGATRVVLDAGAWPTETSFEVETSP